MLFIMEIELGFAGETFYFLNLFVVLNDIFVLELIKRNKIWLLEPATVPKPLVESKGYKQTRNNPSVGNA
jgi:hypothetical protein